MTFQGPDGPLNSSTFLCHSYQIHTVSQPPLKSEGRNEFSSVYAARLQLPHLSDPGPSSFTCREEILREIFNVISMDMSGNNCPVVTH